MTLRNNGLEDKLVAVSMDLVAAQGPFPSRSPSWIFPDSVSFPSSP